MKYKRTFIGILTMTAIIITVSATSLYAQQRIRAGMDRHGFIPGPGDLMGQADNPMRLFRLAEELELSKEQRDSIVRIMDDSRPGIRDNMFKMMDTRKEIRGLMEGEEDVSDRKLRSLTRDQADAMAEMMYLQIKMRKDIRNVLTEEQLAKMKAFRERPRFRDRERFGDPGVRRERMREWRQRQSQDQGQE